MVIVEMRGCFEMSVILWP